MLSEMMSRFRGVSEADIEACVDDAFVEALAKVDPTRDPTPFMRQRAVWRVMDFQRCRRARHPCPTCGGRGVDAGGRRCPGPGCDGGWVGPRTEGLEHDSAAPADSLDDFPEAFSDSWLAALVPDVTQLLDVLWGMHRRKAHWWLRWGRGLQDDVFDTALCLAGHCLAAARGGEYAPASPRGPGGHLIVTTLIGLLQDHSRPYLGQDPVGEALIALAPVGEWRTC